MGRSRDCRNVKAVHPTVPPGNKWRCSQDDRTRLAYISSNSRGQASSLGRSFGGFIVFAEGGGKLTVVGMEGGNGRLSLRSLLQLSGGLLTKGSGSDHALHVVAKTVRIQGNRVDRGELRMEDGCEV